MNLAAYGGNALALLNGMKRREEKKNFLTVFEIRESFIKINPEGKTKGVWLRLYVVRYIRP